MDWVEALKYLVIYYLLFGMLHGAILAVGYARSEPFTRNTFGCCAMLFLYAIPAWLYHTSREAYLDALSSNNNTKA